MNDTVSRVRSRQGTSWMVRRPENARIQPSTVTACVSLTAESPILKNKAKSENCDKNKPGAFPPFSVSILGHKLPRVVSKYTFYKTVDLFLFPLRFPSR